VVYTIVILIVGLLDVIEVQNNFYLNGGAKTSAFRFICGLRCCETLRSVGWYLVTDVLGRLVSPYFKDQEVRSQKGDDLKWCH
jgi:hypothetical protein